MKKFAILFAILVASCYSAFSQDTLYIYRSGMVITKRAISEIDSISFYKNYNIPKPETVTDIDGNVYHTVTIGTQKWLVENLKTTKYRNGDVIGTTSSLYMDLTNAVTPKYQWAYNGSESNVAINGRLYTWHTVMDSRCIAPVGWHVASDAEWTTLQNYLIANGYNYDKTLVDNKIAKSVCSNTSWNNSSVNAGAVGNNVSQNNSSGLTIYPSGYRGFDGYYYLLGDGCDIWTTTEASTTTATIRFMGYQSSSLNPTNSNKNYGFSVRCVKDAAVTLAVLTTVSASSVIDTVAISGGNISSNGGAPIIARGVCWSTSSNPTILGNKTTDSTGIGSFTSKLKGLTPNTTYYVRAYATNSFGTAYGNEQSFKTYSKGSQIVTDIDGNVYHTVTLGDQTWMVENLRTTKLLNGIQLSSISDGFQWSSTVNSLSYCWYGNDSIGNKNTYGALYNWYTVNTRKLAPAGWHIPTKDEINTLSAYLGGNLSAGSKLKESGNTHWSSANTDATNTTGFTALPGGYRSGTTGDYHYLGTLGVFWSSSDSLLNAGRYIMTNTGSEMNYSVDNKMNGFSVRCIKDVALAVLTTKSATAITDSTAILGGNISSNGGGAIIARGICWSTSAGPTISGNKTSDSTGIGSFTSKLKGLTPNTTYYVRAYATNSLGTAYGNEFSFKTTVTTVSDIDGNIYHTVTIGTQTWMVENLKTTHYRNGNQIDNITDGNSWINYSNGAYCWYNNDINFKNVYGALYNGFAVTDARNIAPVGWHVATYDEWTTLATYLGGLSLAGAKMKESGTTHWISPNTDATNTSGFTALPGGQRYISGIFVNLGLYGYYWNNTPVDYSDSKTSVFFYNNANYGQSACSNYYGSSVRCIKD